MAKKKSNVPAKQEPTVINVGDIEMVNSLSNLVDNLAQNGVFQQGAQLSQVDSQYINLRFYLISNNRQLLSQMYVEHGIVQTIVDQPVDDAFRAGFKLKTDELDAQDLEKLEAYLEETEAISSQEQAIKWGRLYGGGGVLILTDQDPSTPLDLDKIKEDSPLGFKDVDMWELYQDRVAPVGTMQLDTGEEFYHYYGMKIHNSRILRVKGKKAPSFVRPRLRGWGMSEIEKLIRSLNSYVKNQDVIFELLDEAKVDVYGIKGFNNALAQKTGTHELTKRIGLANRLKNYNNALTMDADDTYAQKQMNFTGLAEMLLQIRQGIAADLKMPMTKIFGISAAGFNSGEDDIENYNSMIEGEIRSKNKRNTLMICQIACKKLFGFIPEDMKIIWNPLRVLSAEQEETVKEKKFNRVMTAGQTGFASPKEVKQAINKDSLLPIELDENDEVYIDSPEEGDDEPAKGDKE